MLTTLQYRLLRRIAPQEPTAMSGGAYAGRSKLRVLLGDELFAKLRDADVVDFGCGLGEEAVEIAGVARSVYGIDIVPRYLEAARARATSAGVAQRCAFGSEPPSDPVDIVVSIDSFEHFGDPPAVLALMYDLLRPGGQVVTSFGPTWYHPLGGHLFSVFPWAHLLFSETALLRWRADIRSDGATRFHEVEGGLNRMTIARFERLVAATKFRVLLLETVPIRPLRRFHARLTREFTTAIVRCVLERPAN
jgi:SAM-dependent methyltransferase